MKLPLMIAALAASLTLLATTQAQTVPEQIWGKWVVSRKIPTTTISCWGESEAKTLLGTEIEYSAESFRWKDVVTTHPVAEARMVSAEQFHDANSGKGSNSSQITFSQLGIKAKQAMLILIHHSPAKITGGTIEIPGDEVLVKNKDTIVFSACNVYFEAKRVSTASRSRGVQNEFVYTALQGDTQRLKLEHNISRAILFVYVLRFCLGRSLSLDKAAGMEGRR